MMGQGFGDEIGKGLIDEQVEFLASVMMDRANREQEYYSLGDHDFVSPYRQALNQIDATIGRLKAMRREMQRISSHAHDWNDNDYCSICGADGRA